MKVTTPDQYQTIQMDCGELMWLVSKEIGNSDATTVGRSVIRPGQMNPRHYHPSCEEVLHILKGTILHTFNNEEMEMHRGETIVIPANVIHNAKNIGEYDAVIFICFSSVDRQTVSV